MERGKIKKEKNPWKKERRCKQKWIYKNASKWAKVRKKSTRMYKVTKKRENRALHTVRNVISKNKFLKKVTK